MNPARATDDDYIQFLTWATNDLGRDEAARLVFAELSWSIEEYHLGFKPFTGVERYQVRSARGQRNHMGYAIRAVVWLEYHHFTTGVSRFVAKSAVVRDAVRADLSNPRYQLTPGQMRKAQHNNDRDNPGRRRRCNSRSSSPATKR